MFQFRPFPSYAYLIQRTITRYCRVGFPHSEICGYSGYLLLPAAYRSLSRPSSAPDAKAFPLRSSMLDLPKIVPYFLWFSNYAGIQIGFSYEIVIVTLIFSDVVPQLKSYAFLPLCCLAFLLFVQFSRCNRRYTSVYPQN